MLTKEEINLAMRGRKALTALIHATEEAAIVNAWEEFREAFDRPVPPKPEPEKKDD
jgi:hypothetical protein